MAKTILTPTSVTQFAEVLGIPSHIADALYLCVHNKKGSHEPYVFELMRSKRVNERKARELKTQFVKFCRTIKYSEAPITYNAKTTQNSVDQAYERFRDIIGSFPEIHKAPSKAAIKKVVIASDFHYPFLNERAFSRLMEEDADVLIVGGDVLDLYSLSRHNKSLEGISTTDELRGGTAMMGMLAEKFNEVYYINGNHDNRAKKFLQANFPHFLPLLSSPLEAMTRTFHNVKPLSVTALGTAPHLPFATDYSIDSLGTLGDFVISHLDSFSGKDAPEQAYKWLDSFKNHLDLPPVVSAIFQAHTHRLSTQVLSSGKLLVATGCMCQPMPYIFENSGKYPLPTAGYVTFNTDKEFSIDLASVRMVHVGF